MIGKASMPYIVVSEQVLKFGCCSINDYCDIVITITNKNLNYPRHMSLKKLVSLK